MSGAASRRQAAAAQALALAPARARLLGEAIQTGRTISTHFRRGHFKVQPRGLARSLRKHIFIAPIVVNSGKGREIQGRIYDARDVREIP